MNACACLAQLINETHRTLATKVISKHNARKFHLAALFEKQHLLNCSVSLHGIIIPAAFTLQKNFCTYLMHEVKQQMLEERASKNVMARSNICLLQSSPDILNPDISNCWLYWTIRLPPWKSCINVYETVQYIKLEPHRSFGTAHSAPISGASNSALRSVFTSKDGSAALTSAPAGSASTARPCDEVNVGCTWGLSSIPCTHFPFHIIVQWSQPN